MTRVKSKGAKATAKAKPANAAAKAKPAKAAAKAMPAAKAEPAAKAKVAAKATAKATAKAKPAKATAEAKPAAKTKASAETSRTLPPTVSQSAETPRTRASTASDLGSQTRRTRAPTVSERTETPRTRAPTLRSGIVADAVTKPQSLTETLRDAPLANRPRTRGETLVFDRGARAARPRSQTLPFDRSARPARPRSEILRDAPTTVSAHAEVIGVRRDDLGDPARAAELAALEGRIEQLADPDMLVALASQVDTIGMQLAFEISRDGHDAAQVAPLKPVLMRVPAIYGRALVRAAEKFDDLGSPKRAAYVLFEALRKAFDADVIGSVSAALAFILEAHGQGSAAQRLRDLVATREDQRAAGTDRKEVRAQFIAALEQLRDRGVDWAALADDSSPLD